MSLGLGAISLAGLFAAISNLFFRKSIDCGGSSRGYLMIQFTLSFLLFSFLELLSPLFSDSLSFAAPRPFVVAMGFFAGLFLGSLMGNLGCALERGAAGLTFAIVTASNMVPAPLMALIFGSSYGHPYSWLHALGSFVMMLGLFWAARTKEKRITQSRWGTFLILAFASNIVFLSSLQIWAFFTSGNGDLPYGISTVTRDEARWFMPALLLSCAFVQMIIFGFSKNQNPTHSTVIGGNFAISLRLLKPTEWFYGSLGAVTNGGCAYCMVLAPQIAKPWENALLFPLYAVTLILLCNVWARWLYKENVNWIAQLIAMGGILLSSFA